MVTTTQQQLPPAVLEAAEQAWRTRMLTPGATPAECRAASVLAAYRAGLAAATPLNDSSPSSCWALRRRTDGAIRCVAHGQNGGQQLAKILAGLARPRSWELLRWDDRAWVVVAGVA